MLRHRYTYAGAAVALAIVALAVSCEFPNRLRNAVSVNAPAAQQPTYTPLPTLTPYPTLEPPAGYAESVARRETQDAAATPSATPAAATPLAVLPDITPTMSPTPTPTHTPQPAAEATATAKRLSSDDLTRCRHWALTNLKPIVYARFEALNPRTMTDLERALWKQTLDENYLCRDYWSETLDDGNAHKRNGFWRGECYRDMYRGAESVNKQYGGAIAAGVASRNAVNQYARVMNWMDIPGDTLLSMDEPPLQLITRLVAEAVSDGHPAQFIGAAGGNGTYPHNAEVSAEQLKWYALAYAFNYSSACHRYYPQLFQGRWIPDDYGQGRITPTVIPAASNYYDAPNRPLFIPDEYSRQ